MDNLLTVKIDELPGYETFTQDDFNKLPPIHRKIIQR